MLLFVKKVPAVQIKQLRLIFCRFAEQFVAQSRVSSLTE